MKIRDFVKQIGTLIFTVEQARRVVPETEKMQLNIQLSRWIKGGLIKAVKRGVYVQADSKVDELVIARYVYPSSYISLETALNLLGILPDISAEITSIVVGKPRKFVTTQGTFSYSKIAPELYCGFEIHKINDNYYSMAVPEKALMDLIYVRRIRDLSDLRVAWERLDKTKLAVFMAKYPLWVQKEVAKYV